MGGESAAKTACLTYIPYCYKITTQILNWRQSSDFAKLWNWLKNHWFGAVQFFDVVKPAATVPVWFQHGPGTEPPI